METSETGFLIDTLHHAKHRHGASTATLSPISLPRCPLHVPLCSGLADLAHFCLHNGAHDGRSIVYRELGGLPSADRAFSRQVR